MSKEQISHKRNLFEIDNARNLNRRELVDTFVPTQSFWRLLSAKHHILLGSRGSGKTALAKMLSHDHLSLLNDPRAQSAIREQQFIGVYVPTRLEWVGGLKNKPWQTEAQKEEFFQWRLNVSACLALIDSLESCIKSYCGNKGQQAVKEIELATALAESWADTEGISTLDALRQHLQDIEYKKHLLIARSRAKGDRQPSGLGPGVAFETDLFVPLRRGITLASRVLEIQGECTWLVCLDEAEFLEEIHHRIINSHMRTYSDNIFFKMTTMPYCHYTLATNTGVSLDVGHDFEYVYIDSDPALFAKADGEKSAIGTLFARTLFNRRLDASGWREILVTDILGKSVLLDEKSEDWSSDSEEIKLLRRFGSDKTIKRAERLLGNQGFKAQISRKIHGALLLRAAYKEFVGRTEPDIYSGATLVMRCGDANPRRLIRIFNALLLLIWRSLTRGANIPRISSKDQTRVLRKLSTSALVRVQSEPQCGKELFDFLTKIGEFMHRSFHGSPLTTDHISSIRIDSDIPDDQWSLIQRAVELGLLYPNLGPNYRDEMPNRKGIFRFAFILAPHFFLLPRRGHSKPLSAIFKKSIEIHYSEEQASQLDLLRNYENTSD